MISTEEIHGAQSGWCVPLYSPDYLVDALRDLENSPERVKSITGWDWIINAISNAN